MSCPTPSLFSKANAPIYAHAQLANMLAKRYERPKWALFTEVNHEIGGGRRADAIAVAMWRSLGLEVHGFEFKSYRSDWLREIKDPSKAEGVFRFCDRWFLVAGDAVAKEHEIPSPWGWLCARGKSLQIQKPAPKLQPDVLDRRFICSVLRLEDKRRRLDPGIRREYQRGFEEGVSSIVNQNEAASRKYDELAAAVQTFKELSGVSIDAWDGGNIGRAVEAVRHGAAKRCKNDLSNVLRTAERVTSMIRAEIDGLTGIEDDAPGR